MDANRVALSSLARPGWRQRTARFIGRLAATGIVVALAVALLLSAGPALAKTISCALAAECIGTKRDDTITADGQQEVFGKGGNDTIISLGGESNIYGAAGNDKITDEFGSSIIEGGNGNDTIRSKGGKSVLDGGDGDDKITDEFGQSDLDGKAGDDLIRALQGENSITGGGGGDTIEAKNNEGDDIDCGPGKDKVTYDEALDTVTNCEDQRT